MNAIDIMHFEKFLSTILKHLHCQFIEVLFLRLLYKLYITATTTKT